MCESLPFDRPTPPRLGNELLCADCADGHCEDCTTDGCEHFCPSLLRLRVVPNPSEEP